MTKEEYKADISKEIDVPFDVIAKAVADYHEMNPEDIFERTRKRVVVNMRYQFYKLVFKFNESQTTLSKVGSYCEKEYGIKSFDHATVLYGKRTAGDLVDTNSDFKKEYQAIEQSVKLWVFINKEPIKELEDVKRQVFKAESMEEIRNIMEAAFFSEKTIT